MADQNVKQRSVGMFLGLGILFYPLFFSWFTLRKGHTRKARAIAFSWLVVASFIALVVGVLNDRSPSVAGAPITEIQKIAPLTQEAAQLPQNKVR